MAKTIHRYTVGQSGSSQPVETVRVRKDGDEQLVVTPKAEKKSPLLSGADYLLQRLLFTRLVYKKWPRTQRIVVGYLLWLVIVTVIVLVIAGLLGKL